SGDAPVNPSPFQPRTLLFVHERVQAYRVGRDTTRWYKDMYAAPNREGWERTQGYVTSMQRRLREKGAVLAVALWPLIVSLDHYPFDDVRATQERFLTGADIPYVDLLPALRGRPAESLWVHPVDKHPNEIAHRLAADALLPLLQR